MVATAVMIPTRGRPDNIRDMFKVWEATVRSPQTTTMLLQCDFDDPALAGYQALFEELQNRFVPFKWMATVRTRSRLGGALNQLASQWQRQYDVLGFMGDDHRPRTEGWDQIVDSHFMDTVNGVMYGNDLFQGPNLPTAVFMDSRITRTLGWFVLPGQIHLFMDNLWKRIGEELGTLHYEPRMIIEHMHPQAKKSEWDQTYIEANDGGVWAADQKLYDAWVATDMVADIQKIRDA